MTPGAPSTPIDPSAEPPERRSAVRHVVIDANEQGQRLDKVLGRLLPGVPRSRLFRLIRRGEVRVNRPIFFFLERFDFAFAFDDEA